MRTHYEVLGVPQDATTAQIKSAYRRLAKVVHPDAAAEKSDLFALVTDAYDVLNDPARRAAYDAELAAAESRADSGTWGEDERGPEEYRSPGEQPGGGGRSYSAYPGTTQHRTGQPSPASTRKETPAREPLPHLGLVLVGGFVAICAGFRFLTSSLMPGVLFWLDSGDRLLGGSRYDATDTSAPGVGAWIGIIVLRALPALVVFFLAYSFKVSRNDGRATRAGVVTGLVVLFALSGTYPVVFAPIGYRGGAVVVLALVLAWAYLPRLGRVPALRRLADRARSRARGTSPSTDITQP